MSQASRAIVGCGLLSQAPGTASGQLHDEPFSDLTLRVIDHKVPWLFLNALSFFATARCPRCVPIPLWAAPCDVALLSVPVRMALMNLLAADEASRLVACKPLFVCHCFRHLIVSLACLWLVPRHHRMGLQYVLCQAIPFSTSLERGGHLHVEGCCLMWL